MVSSRSSSTASSSPTTVCRRTERSSDRYGMKKRSFISRRSSHDDSFASRHHKGKFSRYGYAMKRTSSRSRRRARSSSSDSANSYHKHSPLKTHRYQSRAGAYSSKRRNYYEYDDYYHRKARASKDLCYQRRRSSSSRRRKTSTDSGEYRHHRRFASKDLCYQSRRSPSSRRRKTSTDSGDDRHHRRCASAIKKRKFEDASDDEIRNEQLRKKYQRSKEKEPPTAHSLSKEKKSTIYTCFLKSGKHMEGGSLVKALKYINLALKLCTKDEKKFLSKIFSRRGDIYSLLEKPRCSFQGFLDWEHAYIIDQDNMGARKQMSKVFFMGANKYYRMKIHEKALTFCNHALDLYDKNGEAFILKTIIDKKLPHKMKKMEDLSGKDFLIPKPGTKAIPEEVLNTEIALCSLNEQVYNEVKLKHLSELIEKAVVVNNLPRAVILINRALKLRDAGDDTSDEIFRKLHVFKQDIMASVNPVPVEER